MIVLPMNVANMADALASKIVRLYGVLLGLFKPGILRSRNRDLFGRKQWSRFCIGAALGSVLEVCVHSITKLFEAGSLQGRTWTGSSASNLIPIAWTFRRELLVLGICFLAIAVPPTFRWACRFARSWWAGIGSALPLLAALSVFTLLNSEPLLLRSTAFSCLLLSACIEFVRHRMPPRSASNATIQIPRAGRGGTLEVGWTPRLGDEPITAWREDILGRASVVEVLADHVLNLCTPILALDGRFGDGKTSVLNLLSAACMIGQSLSHSVLGCRDPRRPLRLIGSATWLPSAASIYTCHSCERGRWRLHEL